MPYIKIENGTIKWSKEEKKGYTEIDRKTLGQYERGEVTLEIKDNKVISTVKVDDIQAILELKNTQKDLKWIWCDC